jgi:transcriptional regulator with XRE-family HTH domain
LVPIALFTIFRAESTALLLTLQAPSVSLGTSLVSVIGRRRTVPALATVRITQFMSTIMAPVSALEVQLDAESLVHEVTQREVLRCEGCKLVQFRTASDTCRRCKKSLLPEPPKAQPVIALVHEPTAETRDGGPQVAAAVRDLRHVRNLSQRQLAARMGVPRTYISKIENGKAMPTLSSLDRLARALQVDISALLRDAPTRHRDESAVLLTDPFLAEIAKYTAHLTSSQKSIFLNHVRELSQSRNRRMA